MKRVVVIGAGGFLGSRVIRALASEFQVSAVVRGGKSELRLNDLPSSVNVIALNGRPVIDLVRECDPWGVVYAAVSYGVDGGIDSLTETNVEVPCQIAEYLSNQGNKLFITFDTFYSKFENYQHLSGYQRSKRECLARLQQIRAPYPLVNLMLEQVYGPGDSPSKAFAGLVRSIAKREPSLSLTPGEQKRDFIFVDDVARAVRTLALHSDRLPAGVTTMGVGTGESRTLKSVLELMKQLSGSSTLLNFGDKPYRVGEPMDSFAEIELLRTLGWNPVVPLSDGISAMITEFADNPVR